MKLSTSLFAILFVAFQFTSCSSDDPNPDEADNAKPKSGTSKTITQEIIYHSGLIEGTTTLATWPIAKFAVDENAVKYSVKVLKTGATYTWESDKRANSAFYVFPSQNDLVDGYFYIGLDRTWCAGCKEVDPSWQEKYITYFGVDNKVEITFFY